ncbi:hypothetical protein X975_17833, partial [Stegodyphus mimosarum]
MVVMALPLIARSTKNNEKYGLSTDPISVTAIKKAKKKNVGFLPHLSDKNP